jgi:ATP-dependent DNA helicase RecG
MKIPKREDLHNEFKISFGKELIETVVAFANTKGGVIYLGLDDNAQIVGLDIGKNSIEDWANQIKQQTEPAILVEMVITQCRDKNIVLIKVDEFPIKPVSTRGKSYKRVNASNHLLSLHEVSEMFLHTFQRSWDSYPSTHIENNKQLDLSLIDKFLIEARDAKKFDLPKNKMLALKKIKIINEKGITNAAELLFTNDHLYFIRIGKFKDPSKIIDDKQLRGSLLDQVEQAYRYIIDKLEVEYDIIPGEIKRKEIWEYPLDVLREILVNAIIHRNYQLAGDVQIKIFSNMITFFNPGKFHSGVTIEKIKTDHYQSRSRNVLISEAFYISGKIEKYGSGFIRIRKSLKDFPHIKFSIEESGDGVLVTLEKQAISGQKQAISGQKQAISGQKQAISKNNEEMVIGILMQSDSGLAVKEFMQLLGLSASRTRAILNNLVKLKKIKKVGINKGTKYYNR